MRRRADADVRERARAQRDASVVAQRLHGVARHVQQRLDELVAVEHGARQARVVVALDQQRRRRLGAQQVKDVLAELMDVELRLLGGRFGPVMRVHQRAEPIGLADDDAGVFLERLVRQLALEQLRRAAQAAQRVFDLVRELPQHQATAVQARQHVVLARDALPLRGVGELEQQVRAGDLPSSGVMVTSSVRASRGVAAGRRPARDRRGFAGLERAAQDPISALESCRKIAEGSAAAWFRLKASRSCAATLA